MQKHKFTFQDDADNRVMKLAEEFSINYKTFMNSLCTV